MSPGCSVPYPAQRNVGIWARGRIQVIILISYVSQWRLREGKLLRCVRTHLDSLGFAALLRASHWCRNASSEWPPSLRMLPQLCQGCLVSPTQLCPRAPLSVRGPPPLQALANLSLHGGGIGTFSFLCMAVGNSAEQTQTPAEPPRRLI